MRSILTFLCATCALFAFGQCTLTITAFNAQENCSNFGSPQVGVNWSGGTPPFELSFVTDGGATTVVSTWEYSWNGELIDVGVWDTQLTMTVTDAMGCVDAGPFVWVNHVPVQPEVFPNLVSCTIGYELRWTGMLQVLNFQPQPSWCPGPFAYSVQNTSTGATWNGNVVDDWVQEANYWRYSGPLPAGNYLVDIYPLNSGPGPSCYWGVQTDCYLPRSLVVPIDPGDCGTNFNLRAALAGALPTGTLMIDQLRSAGLVPTSEPYSALGYTYTGSTPGVTVLPSMLAGTGNNAIVDWVVVEIRSAAVPATVLFSRPALIQRDGDVVGTDGASYINTPLAPGNYHIALRHRNHLGVMTGSSRMLTQDPTGSMIDFRLSSTSTLGSNARTTVGTVQCLWPGDANHDGTIQYTGIGNDRDPVLVAIGGSVATNTVTNIYSPLDINMNGTISYTGLGNDRDVILQTIGGTVATATRTQQLP